MNARGRISSGGVRGALRVVSGALRRMACVVLLVALATGCAGPVEATVTVEPPAPVPSPEDPQAAAPPAPSGPEDEDGDGLVGSADGCPQQAETKNDFEDDDGCPDEVPAVYLAGDEVRFQEPIRFGPAGIDRASQSTVEALGEVLGAAKGVELVEVAVGFAGKQGDRFASRQRAQMVVDALAKRGVDRKRLRAAGYGRCGGDGDGFVVNVTVVRRGGRDTGAELGCAP